MKKLALCIIILLVTVSSGAYAGGVNIMGGMGPRSGAMSGGGGGTLADDYSLFYYNPALLSQFETMHAEMGMEILIPKFKLENSRTRKSRSGIWHQIPSLCLIDRLNNSITVGVGVNNAYGLGARFDRDLQSLTYKSETMLTLTNISTGLALELGDGWTIGISVNLGLGQFKYQAPFDVKSWPLPIATDSEAQGFGVSETLGLLYQPNERFRFALTYMTESEVKLHGQTEIGILCGKISDDFDSEFTFPSRLGASLAFRPVYRLVVGLDAYYYNYSKTPNEMKLKFDRIPFDKCNDLSWHDNYSLHLGARYLLNDYWSVAGGVGYQTAAIPSENISQLMPDVTGWDVSTGLSYQRGHFSFDVHAIYGWGDDEAQSIPDRFLPRPTRVEAEVVTIGANFCWQF